jgi:hypothetical protein
VLSEGDLAARLVDAIAYRRIHSESYQRATGKRLRECLLPLNPDKGKPVARLGRKAKGRREATRDGSLATEGCIVNGRKAANNHFGKEVQSSREIWASGHCEQAAGATGPGTKKLRSARRNQT